VERSRFEEVVDANTSVFLAPESMKAAFDAALGMKPGTAEDYFRCAYRSLAESYRNALAELEHNTGRFYDRIYIVGGGAKNDFLNRLTEEATGKQAIVLPIEATAIGNLKVQMEMDK
jgi:rhamnulokinase